MDLLEMYRGHWRAESERVQREMDEHEWIDANTMIDRWAAKHGMETNVPVPVE